MNNLPQDEFNELASNLLNFLENNEYSEALTLFLNCTEQEQKILFKYISFALKRAENLAVRAPTVITIINRTLKTGKSFGDFYEAWKPPVEGVQIEEGKHMYSYFDLPTRVINAQSISSPSEILSVGLLWGENEKQFQEEIHKREKAEQIRHEKIIKVADKSDSNRYYLVLTDDILGP